jgi:hypothetical protein
MPGSKAVKERIELLIAQAPSGVTAILDARVGAGFKVDLVKPNRPPGEKCPLSAASPLSSPPTWRDTRA